MYPTMGPDVLKVLNAPGVRVYVHAVPQPPEPLPFGGFILGLGLLQLPFFIASAFYIIGLTGFYIFFVATKRYAAQIASLS